MVSFAPVKFAVPSLKALTEKVLASAAGGVAGTMAGAEAGTIVAGPIGTVIGGVVGGVASYFVGGEIQSLTAESAYAFCFYIANNSSSSVQVDVSEIFGSKYATYTGNVTVEPQTSQQIFFAISDSTIQQGSTPLLTVDGTTVNFRFWSGFTNGMTYQYINILVGDVTVDTSSQNNSSVGNCTIGVGGNGGPLISTNIWVIIENA